MLINIEGVSLSNIKYNLDDSLKTNKSPLTGLAAYNPHFTH